MAARLGLVLDCADPDRLAEFWSAAIGYSTLGGAGNYVLLVDESGQQPKLLLQRVTEPKSGKNRMHFDIETPAVDDEVECGRALVCRHDALLTGDALLPLSRAASNARTRRDLPRMRRFW